ncbi:Response regulator rcp1 [Dyadobacter sp. CECT 9275]|uniref:Response regulator rcp1 n=1 Tax=Dyadobacter helix TaxID=2822344 RepID=A0A916JJ52_9BACT|nr:response regulator [Dyadobacter sp. CECT 9275]CAG5018290.1 Response regulator rcp1 [Dyadobacter sp. CECT 9275]
MSLAGPVISVEDDEDDQYLIREILDDLQIPNAVRFFSNGSEALDYLTTTTEKPFLILCDVNMPVMNGLELRSIIEANPVLKKKAIPFIFLSTSDNKALLNEVYKGTIQGYFKKQGDYAVFRKHMDVIIRYWQTCLHPNK